MVTFTADKTYGFKLNATQLEKLTAWLAAVPGMDHADDTKQVILRLAEYAATRPAPASAGPELERLTAENKALTEQVNRLRADDSSASLIEELTELRERLNEVNAQHEASVKQHTELFSAQLNELKDQLAAAHEKIARVKTVFPNLRHREQEIIRSVIA